MRINLIDPSRARQLAEYLAIKRIEWRMVTMATPRILLHADGTFEADYSESAPSCPICTLTRERRWRACALHGRP